MNMPLLIFVLSALAGLMLAVAGVFMLSGPGWALIAGAIALLLIAGFVRKGLIGE